MHKKKNKNNQRRKAMQKEFFLIIARQNIHFKAIIHALNIILAGQKFNNHSKSNRLRPHRKTKRHTLSDSSKSVRHSIKQPALKWANKISAAKKRMLDAQKKR